MFLIPDLNGHPSWGSRLRISLWGLFEKQYQITHFKEVFKTRN